MMPMILGRIDRTAFVMTDEEWAEVNKGSDWPTFTGLACVIALTFGAITFFTWRFESLWIALVVCPLAVSFFNQVAQVTHFASHAALVPSRHIEMLVGRISSAALGYTLDGFSRTHLSHHNYLNGPDDGDRLWAVQRITRCHVLTTLLEDLFGISTGRRALQYYFDRQAKLRTTASNILLVVVTQFAILAIFHTVRGWEFYFLFYVLPLISLYPLLARLRSTCEHIPLCSVEGGNYWYARTFDLNCIERFVLGPAQQHYHLEHHLVPNASPRQLQKIRGFLEARHDLRPVKARSYLALAWNILWMPSKGVLHQQK